MTILIYQETNVQVSLFNMCVPSLYKEKKYYWDSLETLKHSYSLQNLILVGNLNLILSHYEKRGGSLSSEPFWDSLENLITEWDLIDLKPKKGNNTWTNKKVGPRHVAAEIDHFLV